MKFEAKMNIAVTYPLLLSLLRHGTSSSEALVRLEIGLRSVAVGSSYNCLPERRPVSPESGKSEEKTIKQYSINTVKFECHRNQLRCPSAFEFMNLLSISQKNLIQTEFCIFVLSHGRS